MGLVFHLQKGKYPEKNKYKRSFTQISLPCFQVGSKIIQDTFLQFEMLVQFKPMLPSFCLQVTQKILVWLWVQTERSLEPLTKLFTQLALPKYLGCGGGGEGMCQDVGLCIWEGRGGPEPYWHFLQYKKLDYVVHS